MKKARRISISRLAEERDEVAFADLVDGTLTGERFEAVMHEKGGAPFVRAAAPAATVPEQQLDLHGMTEDEARRRTVYFLQNCHHQGLALVRVVTGKGLHSDGEAVLPAAIEDTLLGLKSKGDIHSFQWEKGDRRRSGALLVYLLPGQTG